MVKSVPFGSSLLHYQELGLKPPLLDPTAPRHKLLDSTASEVLGLDVVSKDVWRPDRGRRPVGVTLPESDHPLTFAQSFDIRGRVAYRYSRIRSLAQTQVGANDNAIVNLSASWNQVTGTITQVGAFASYSFQTLRDYIHGRENGQGYLLPVLSRISNDEVRVSPGLGVVTSGIGGFLARGKSLVFVAQVENAVDATQFYDVLVKTKELYDEEGPWSAEDIGAQLIINEDSRLADVKRFPVRGIFSFCQTNDSLILAQYETGSAISFPTVTTNQRHKHTLLTTRVLDFEGVLVGNGRKFWLLEDTGYRLLLDLGDDSFRGVAWRATQIAANRLMLTAPGHAPRILHLSRTNTTAGDETLAGLPAPQKPNIDEVAQGETIRNASWLGAITVGGGSLSATGSGDGVEIVVRLANLDDGVYSDFVPVVKSIDTSIPTDTTEDTLRFVVAALDRISVYPAINGDEQDANNTEIGYTPPISRRATHLEIWRTFSSVSSAFFREALIPLMDPMQEPAGVDTQSWMDPTPANRFPVRLSDVDIQELPILTDAIRQAYQMPPVCRESSSLKSVTLCFGKASDTVVSPNIYASNFAGTNGTYTTATGVFDLGSAEFDNFDAESFLDGDELVVVESSSTPEFPRGVYPITGSGGTGQATIAANITASDVSGVIFYIRRRYPVAWPKITNDEEVWYSRTDDFTPENFPARILRLSTIGDAFRRAINMKEYTVVVMDQGVHLLYLEGTTLKRHTVADYGKGTPWPESVIPYGENVYWATARGVNVLTLTPEVDETGRRGRVLESTGLRFESFFKDAFRSGDTIDAGADTLNGCLRFRRTYADGSTKTLQFSFLTDQWTFLDDDTGFRYVNTTALADTPSPLLYSVEPTTGAVFELNTDFDYAGMTLSGPLTGFVVESDQIRAPSGLPFSPLLVGEPLRLYNGTTEHLRIIRAASADRILFDLVPDLDTSWSYAIASRRVRIRFASMRGTRPNTTKTLYAGTARLLPGDDPPTSPVTLRAYENFQNIPSSQDTVDIFSDEEDGRTSEDRVLSLTAQGSAIEVEIESLRGRNDFAVDQLEFIYREENVEQTDAQT